MGDILTPKQRSYCMSRIRSKWTLQESKIHNALKGLRIRHRMHPDLPGSPDIIISEAKIVVFLHGCFWHQHKNCKNVRIPKSNSNFWIPKLKRNVQRDLCNARRLKKLGYRVRIIWECEIGKRKEFKGAEKLLIKKLKLRNED